MELGPMWAEWGLVGLFFASFLAATLLPFSSEAVLAAMALGSWSTNSLLLASSIGNTLGGMVNYGIGRWIPSHRLVRWSGIDPAQAHRWSDLAARHGAWGALLCWLPFIGDPIALALGTLRVKALPCVVLMFVGKALRYVAVLAMLRPLWGG